MPACLGMAALSLGALRPNGHAAGNQGTCFKEAALLQPQECGCPVGKEARLHAQGPSTCPPSGLRHKEGAAYGCLSLGRALGVMAAPKSRGQGERLSPTTRLGRQDRILPCDPQPTPSAHLHLKTASLSLPTCSWAGHEARPLQGRPNTAEGPSQRAERRPTPSLPRPRRAARSGEIVLGGWLRACPLAHSSPWDSG